MSFSEGTGFQPAWVRLGIALSIIAVPAFAPRAPLFQSEIMPVLEKNCVMCHGDKQKMAGLDLSSFSGMMAGSSSGPVIAPGKPERSLLWKMIENDQMPQGGKLTAAEKQTIHAYIEQGRFPTTEESEGAIQAREAAKITQKNRDGWAFRKPGKTPAP